MNQNKTVQFVPEGQFSTKDLDVFLRELEIRFKHKEVMHRKEVSEFMGLSERTVDRLSKPGGLPFHTIEGLSGKLYLRSELIEHIKKS
jgi:predicted DNA-binding transcriptional regulator AlpA